MLAQVYKGVRSGVQPVAIKVLSEVNDAEAAAFAEVGAGTLLYLFQEGKQYFCWPCMLDKRITCQSLK